MDRLPPVNAADLLTAAAEARPGASGTTAVHWVDRDRSLTYPDDAWEQMERHGTTVLCGTTDHCTDLLAVCAARGRKPSALRALVIRTTATTPESDDVAHRLRTELHVDLLMRPQPSHTQTS